MTGARYDLAIIGAGLAGLSLAVRLAERPDLRVVVLEPRTAYARDRTWSYWRLHGHPFEDAVARRWTSWEIRTPAGSTRAGSAALPYETIPADRFYASALARLDRAPHVELRLGSRVASVENRGERVVLTTEGGKIEASYAFDSRPPAARPGTLVQRFLGQKVVAPRPVFDPDRVTLMDFRVGKGGEPVHFIYVLPFSETEALVEDTWFAPPDACLPDHRDAIGAYLAERFGLGDHATVFEEAGAIPMDARLQAPKAAGRIIPIGTAGGAIKPSSGYGFLSIQRGADRILADLQAGRPPTAGAHRGAATRWMDAVLLERLHRRPGDAPRLFERLFARCPPAPLIRFLGDMGRPADYARVIAAMPKAPMIAAALAERGLRGFAP